MGRQRGSRRHRACTSHLTVPCVAAAPRASMQPDTATTHSCVVLLAQAAPAHARTSRMDEREQTTCRKLPGLVFSCVTCGFRCESFQFLADNSAHVFLRQWLERAASVKIFRHWRGRYRCERSELIASRRPIGKAAGSSRAGAISRWAYAMTAHDSLPEDWSASRLSVPHTWISP